MAVQALGDTDLIQSLGLSFMQKKGIVNIWTLIPPEKQTLYQCAYQVIKAANDAFKAPPNKDEAAKWSEKRLAMWKAGQAARLLETVDSMSVWMNGTVSYTVYVVQKVSDWFAKHGWEHLKAPLAECVKCAINVYGDCGWRWRWTQEKENKEVVA